MKETIKFEKKEVEILSDNWGWEMCVGEWALDLNIGPRTDSPFNAPTVKHTHQ